MFRVRFMERMGEFARRMNLSADEARQVDNEVVEHAFLIWKLDDERANLNTGSSKTE